LPLQLRNCPPAAGANPVRVNQQSSAMNMPFLFPSSFQQLSKKNHIFTLSSMSIEQLSIFTSMSW
jgi:hypothetical protein